MAILYCDGERFRRAFLAGAGWLSENKEVLNQLNVFPVPDGDTGINMSLTLLSAVDELKGMEGASLGEVLAAVARDTLMGARGCSGVIFSQLLAGFAEVGHDKARFTSRDIAASLQLGSERAYRAVTEPVEGTILTVIRESSEEAAQFAGDHEDIVRLLEITLNRAKISLENSPNLLPVLAQAGVVDAGGQGFVYMLEGVLRLVRGDAEDEHIGSPLQAVDQSFASPPLGRAQARVSESWDNPYCTEFLLLRSDGDISNIRKGLTELGSDLAVVGWNELVRVHIHTSDPERVLAFSSSYGKPSNVKIDDTRKQHRHIVQVPLGVQQIEAEREISIVTTAPGDGMKAICMSLGAESVVVGDQTRNPSVSELICAIDDSYSDDVLLLPNDGNIIPAATQAANMSRKQVKIVPSKNISQGLSALIAFRPNASLDDNISSMEIALEEVKHGEVARAVRDAQYGDLVIRENDIIGLFDGSVRVAERDHREAVLELLRLMVEDDDEIITIFYGTEIGRSEAEELLEEVIPAFPEEEVELHYGGQSYCSYILSVE
jgi:DAK2 domain fusion protein YloV